ncbi:MAG TPA: sigma-70 family RNA polymerase sigma factor [Polyangiaceae bacterium]
MDDTPAAALPEHYFRREFGRLVSVLSRRFGVSRLELCEDAAQTALLRAVEAWSSSGVPHDRGAWLYRVAQNHVLDGLRRDKRSERYAPDIEREVTQPPVAQEVYLESEVEDDLLRLLFVCADPKIVPESQLVLALKTLCGFSTAEIALRLFQSEDAVHKRLQRARAKLREHAVELDTPRVEELMDRVPRVLQMLYLLFNEGYSSAQAERVIRRELCEEAIRLARLLAAHALSATPEAHALLSLMYFQAARFEARVDGAGEILLMDEQDRSLWDRELVELGVYYLHRAAVGERFSRYHAEAAIAAEHCLAPSFAHTRWEEITRLYEMLERVAPSPLNTLNRAIALAAWKGPDAGLAVLEALDPPRWLAAYYLWDATLGELYRRRGDHEEAAARLSRALQSAPTLAEKSLIRRRLDACASGQR